MGKHPLFTTGYAGFVQQDFLYKLQMDEVEVVVDVREKPISRNRGFSKSTLSAFLEDNGIEYVHFKELGVPSSLRQKLRGGGSLARYFTAYRKHLDHHDEAVSTLFDLVKQKRCCLLCLESNPDECHRSVLAEALVARDGKQIEVKHI